MHVYEVRPCKDKRGFDLISDALPFGRLWYTELSHAIGYAEFRRHYAIFKKTCGSGGVRVESPLDTPTRQPSEVDTLMLVDAGWSGNFERGEVVSPIGCIAGKVSV
jgi:hypothetical protein